MTLQIVHKLSVNRENNFLYFTLKYSVLLKPVFRSEVPTDECGINSNITIEYLL